MWFGHINSPHLIIFTLFSLHKPGKCWLYIPNIQIKTLIANISVSDATVELFH